MRSFGFSAALLLLPGLALAQGRTPPPPSALAPLYQCAEQTDTAARLACYDAAVADLKGKEARKEVVAIDKAGATTLRREAFGFRLPSLPKLGLPGFSSDGRDVETKQTKSVASVNGLTLTTTDAQIWQLTENVGFDPPSRTPFDVVISQAALGSYLLQIKGMNRSWRARRLE